MVGRFLRLQPLMFGLVSAVACGGGGGDDGGGTPPPTTTIAKTATDNGDQQSGTVGQFLDAQLRVLVTQDGVPAAGVTVSWSTNNEGGDVSPTSTTTDASGIATAGWTLGTAAGPQAARASLTGAAGSPVTFSATALADAPATLAELGGNGQIGVINTALSDPVQAKVSDQFGNAVPGVSVDWAATNATVSAATVPSDASGVSGVTVTLGSTPGPVTITATAGTLAGSPQTFTATATAAPPPSSDVAVADFVFQPSTLTVPAGTTVTWTWEPGATSHNVTPVPTATQPGASGTFAAPHTYQFTFNTPGTYNYYCTLHGSPTSGMRGTIVVQ